MNPALTIIANALRVGDHLLERLGRTSHELGRHDAHQPKEYPSNSFFTLNGGCDERHQTEIRWSDADPREKLIALLNEDLAASIRPSFPMWSTPRCSKGRST